MIDVPKHDRLVIQGYDYSGSLCQLVDSNGNYVRKGDQYRDFRGDTDIIMAGRAPHKECSKGFVYRAGGVKTYAGVYDLKWVRV